MATATRASGSTTWRTGSASRPQPAGRPLVAIGIAAASGMASAGPSFAERPSNAASGDGLIRAGQANRQNDAVGRLAWGGRDAIADDDGGGDLCRRAAGVGGR